MYFLYIARLYTYYIYSLNIYSLAAHACSAVRAHNTGRCVMHARGASRRLCPRLNNPIFALSARCDVQSAQARPTLESTTSWERSQARDVALNAAAPAPAAAAGRPRVPRLHTVRALLHDGVIITRASVHPHREKNCPPSNKAVLHGSVSADSDVRYPRTVHANYRFERAESMLLATV
jgi:hypothetical protein